uniref:Uncharacterized protein n=1 Tax=Arundo donax TaxID=35708 RepID=A0A0A9FN00_ARUDO
MHRRLPVSTSSSVSAELGLESVRG